jgi:hypothetical protein
LPLPIDLLIEIMRGQPQLLVKQNGAIFRHSPDRQFRILRRTEFMREDNIQRSIQSAGDFAGHDDPAARNTQHHTRRLIAKIDQRIRQLPPGLYSIEKHSAYINYDPGISRGRWKQQFSI